MKKNNGFTLLECLISLLFIQLILYFSLSCFSMIQKISFNHDEIQDFIAIYQLRQAVSLGEWVIVFDDVIEYDYKEELYFIELINNKLMITPGTDIVLDHIDEVYFEETANEIFMIYTRGDITRRVKIR